MEIRSRLKKKRKGGEEEGNGVIGLFRMVVGSLIRFRKASEARSFPKVELSKKGIRWVLLLIIVFSLGVRLAWLAKPDHEYFDEVYLMFV